MCWGAALGTCILRSGTRYTNSGLDGLKMRRLSVGTRAKAPSANVNPVPISSRLWMAHRCVHQCMPTSSCRTVELAEMSVLLHSGLLAVGGNTTAMYLDSLNF